jgi:hypothetical protein
MSILTLTLDPLKFLPLPVEFCLISSYLLVLLLLLVLLALELVTDQGACAETESATNRSAGTRMANGRANKAAGRSASKSANPGSLFSCRERPSRATYKDKAYEDDGQQKCCSRFNSHHA